jgi:hypothetical protein
MKNQFFVSAFFFLNWINLFSQAGGLKLQNRESSIKSDLAKTVLMVNSKEKSYYKTIEFSKWNRLGNEIDELLETRKVLLTEIEDPGKDEATWIENVKKIKSIDSELKVKSKERDSFYHIYTKDYLLYKPIISCFGANRSRAFFDIIYDGQGKRFRVLNNTGFNIGNNTGSIYSELASGNLYAVRVSLGTMVASNSNDNRVEAKQEEALQRLQTYGGNAVLNIEYPLLYAHSRGNRSSLISRLVSKGTADFPEFGTNTEDFAGSLSLGLDIYGDASLDNNSLRFFFNFNINEIYGTRVFKDNLGIDNSSFIFGQLTIGFVVAENLKFSLIVSTFSTEDALKNNKVVFGGQIIH